MLLNNLKIAIRTILRNKTFSALNIAGLAVSLGAFILMGLYIRDELSFDRFHYQASNIYRVVDDKQTPDLFLHSAQTAAPVAPALLQEFTNVKEAVRLIGYEGLIKFNEKIFEERNLFYTDASVFRIFSFKLLAGDKDKALSEPQTMVLTASMAKKYFGNDQSLGKFISVDGKNFKVTGIVDDVPTNSHIQFDFLLSMKTLESKDSGDDWMFTNWYSNNFHTYILLPEHYDISGLKKEMTAFDARHKEAKSNTIHHYDFEKLESIYLHSSLDNQIGKTGSITNIYIFSAIAIFMLLIACINYVNLSTARAISRAKEVAVKKVAGASRRQMTFQFLTESFLMCTIAVILALLAVYIILPAFNAFSGKDLTSGLFNISTLVTLLLITCFISLLSGSYPAFVLSGFKPVSALKGKLSPSGWSITIRKGLVVFQFAITVVLIVCTIVVYVQMNYLQQHELGFQPAQTVVINFEGDKNVRARISAIRQELLRIPSVEKITASSNVPGDGKAGNWSMDFVKKTGDTIHTEMPLYSGDYDYLKQYQIPVVAGRTFSNAYADDSTRSMLINETALHTLGFSSAEDAIGVKVGMYPDDGIIIGVVRDFHFESLQKKLAPLALRMLPFRYRLFSININTANISQTLAAIESTWKKLVPERPIDYSFLDESFNRQYQSEQKFGQVFNVFTGLVILIASLGLFGLSLFSVQYRKKEIGVRKVLGASVSTIAITLSKEFIKLIVIATIVAAPVAYYFMSEWLSGFAYRISLNAWTFIIAGLAAAFIALATISYHTIKAAIANPVKSLRAE